MVCLNNEDMPVWLAWLIPMSITGFSTLVIAVGIHLIFKKQRKRKVTRLIFEYVYMFSLVFELGVALRVQFPHTPLVIRIICIVTTVSSGISLFCLIGDVVYQYRKKIALQGHRRGLPCFLYCLVCFRGLFGLIEMKDKIAIGSAMTHFLIRLGETLLRFLGRSFLPKFFSDNDFSIFPFVFCLTTWVSRVLDNRPRSRNFISVLIVGDAPALANEGVPGGAPAPINEGVAEPPQGGAPGAGAGNIDILIAMPPQGGGAQILEQPGAGVGAGVGAGAGAGIIPPGAPDSVLLQNIVNGNQAYIRKTFDLWSAEINLDGGRTLTLNSWTVRVSQDNLQISWQLPAVNFVALHFSLLDRASANSVDQRWVQFLRDHAPNVPIVLVGTGLDARDANAIAGLGDVFTTAEGQRLALEIGAIAYVETKAEDTGLLVGRLDEILSDFL